LSAVAAESGRPRIRATMIIGSGSGSWLIHSIRALGMAASIA
jgi:hypothetical protein